MKISALTVVSVLAGIAAAVGPTEEQLLSMGIPKCAVACLTSAYQQTGCGAEDIACQCSAKSQDIMSRCLLGQSGCGTDDLVKASGIGATMCASQQGAAPGGGASAATGGVGGAGSGAATANASSAPPAKATTTSAPAVAKTTTTPPASAKTGLAAPSNVPGVGLLGLVGAAAIMAL